MPRSPYFSGALATGGQVRGPDRAPDFMEIPGQLESAIGKAIGGMFYNPERDPRAQQARLYSAQADKAQSEADQLNAQQRARMGLPDLMASMTGAPTNRGDVRPEGEPALPGDTRLTEAQHREADARDRDRAQSQGAQTLLATGIGGEDVSSIMAALGAAMGDDSDVARYGAARGKYIGENEAVSLTDREGVATRNDIQETGLNDDDNDSLERRATEAAGVRRDGYRMAFDGTRYTADKRAETATYDTDVDASTARDLAIIDSGDSRYDTDADSGSRIEAAIIGATQSGRNADTAAGSRRDVARIREGVPVRERPRAAPAPAARPARPAAAPAAPARTRTPPRIRLDRDGNPR